MSELYYFTDGLQSYRFTPTPFKKVVGSNTYTPTAVQRSNITLTDNFAKSPVAFRFARTDVFALMLLNTILERPMLVQVMDSGENILWQGQVLKVTGKDNISIDIHCDTKYVAGLGRKGNFIISNLCVHTLYSTQCGVVKFLHLTIYENINVTGTATVISVPNLSSPAGTLNNGFVELQGLSRRIITNTANTITISQPFFRNLLGTLNVYPGCDLTETNCIAFNNLPNHLGFKRLPSKNPFLNVGLI
jgi:hypothetical protein